MNLCVRFGLATTCPTNWMLWLCSTSVDWNGGRNYCGFSSSEKSNRKLSLGSPTTSCMCPRLAEYHLGVCMQDAKRYLLAETSVYLSEGYRKILEVLNF